MPRREAARRAGDSVKSHAIKILMNSFYGVLGTSACRFYDPRLANAITGFGQEVLLWCRARIEAGGRRVLYGDTDSLFVEIGRRRSAGRARGRRAPRRPSLNRDLAAHIEARWRVDEPAGADRSTACTCRLFFPCDAPRRRGRAQALRRPGRDGRRASSSRAWRRCAATGPSWPSEVQRELYARLFADQPVEEYLRVLVAELRAGRLDDRLVYRKSLRKSPEAYTATTPPHVAAARKQEGRARGRVAYVVTTAGPEPAASARRTRSTTSTTSQKQVRAGRGAGARPARPRLRAGRGGRTPDDSGILKGEVTVPEARYVSSQPYESARIYAAAVYCSDGRLGDHVDDFLHNGLGLPRYDRVACPGGPVALSGRLAAHWEARGVEEQLRFLVQVHEIRKVVLVAHVGCAYYSRKLLLAPEKVEQEQVEDLQKAQWAVERLVPGIEVSRYLLRVEGTEVAFDAIVR